ncbi:MAG: hypothetical protein ACJAWG_001511 [Candidatus Azotimanducaceae bacterium]|jgi:hypothetical protein
MFLRQTIEPDESVLESTLHFSQSQKTMPGRINYLVLALLTLLLSSCQTFNDSLDKIGGMFVKDKPAACEGDSCEGKEGELLDNSNTNQSWYCYGEVRGAAWDCQDRPDAEKIMAIIEPPPEPIISPFAKPIIAQAFIPSIFPSTTTSAVAEIDAQPLAVTPAAAKKAPANDADIALAEVAAVALETDTAPVSSDNATGEPVAAATTNPDLPIMVGGNETLLSQPESFYTVQIITMRDEDDIIKYARLNGLQYPLYTRIANDGGIWYVLLLGVYPDVDTAQQAMTDWQRAKNLKVDPWVRQLGTLQASIRRAQQAG